MAYKTIHTSYGLMRLAQAEATGVPINLTHMAVGDGNGNAVTPDPAQSLLVRERYRAVINRVYQHHDDPLRFTAELVIPATVGGFTLREVGIFDDAGSLFVVGNLPATYKPTQVEGAFSDTVVRVDFLVSNASTITLQIDPNVIVVTQQWISNNVTAGSLIPGGTTGQILAKVSNADGDVHWTDPTAANVVVDTVAEKQTLAANQTNVDLTLTITYGLAVYIEGVRLPRGTGANEWQPDANISTRVILGKSYPDGTIFQGVNNEPAGSAPAPLERSKNLSDVQSAATSRTNLGVMSATDTTTLARQQAPSSLIAAFARSTAPAGWLKANGAAVSRTAYADLFSAIGTTFGSGDGFNTFNLPDLRGEFVRGWADGRNIDAGRVFGSAQGQLIESHDHGMAPYKPINAEVLQPVAVGAELSSVGVGDTVRTQSTGGSETRPRNVALLYCIKI
jgi:phage-related tail fiber protein